ALELCVRVFFFSSRRRHTRFSRDWSSDVCSSDLQDAPSDSETAESNEKEPSETVSDTASSRLEDRESTTTVPSLFGEDDGPGTRSEERRVGKESRAEWPAE